jgi:hypothetical protein
MYVVALTLQIEYVSCIWYVLMSDTDTCNYIQLLSFSQTITDVYVSILCPVFVYVSASIEETFWSIWITLTCLFLCCYFQIGNPLLEFNTDFNSRAEFLWSHGLISDSAYESFTKICNYSQIRREYQSGTFSIVCSRVNRLVSMEVSIYIYLIFF